MSSGRYSSASSAMLEHRYGAGEKQAYWRTALRDVVGTPEWRSEMLANRVLDDVEGTLHGYGIRGSRGPAIRFLNEEMTLGYGDLGEFDEEDLDDEDLEDFEDEYGVLFPKLLPRQRSLKVSRKQGVFAKHRPKGEKAASPAYWLRRAGHALSGRFSEKKIRKHLRKKQRRLSREAYGSLPLGLSGSVQLQPVLAPGVDTGAVELGPVAPSPTLSSAAEEGVDLGFKEFLADFMG